MTDSPGRQGAQKLSAGRKTAIRKVARARARNQRGVVPMRPTHA